MTRPLQPPLPGPAGPLGPLSAARFESQRRRLTALARRWLGSQADAEDAVQDTYLRVAGACPASADGAAAWLAAVLHHVCIDRLRRRRLEQREAGLAAREAAAQPALAPAAEQSAALAIEAQQALRHMARCLRPDDMLALVLHVVFDVEHAEIARLAGQSEATVRQRTHRALCRFRRVTGRPAGPEVRNDGPATAGADERRADRAEDARRLADAHLVELCRHALQSHSAAGLLARLSMSGRAAGVEEVRATPSAAGTRAAAGATVAAIAPPVPSSMSTLVPLDGGFALAWVLDGVMLCSVPLEAAPAWETTMA